ncbi:MAG: hypothetical protein GXY82_09550 [Methanospirillum sp.]|nr:hypothetical protein [Methanospirillum sp.]
MADDKENRFVAELQYVGHEELTDEERRQIERDWALVEKRRRRVGAFRKRGGSEMTQTFLCTNCPGGCRLEVPDRCDPPTLCPYDVHGEPVQWTPVEVA